MDAGCGRSLFGDFFDRGTRATDRCGGKRAGTAYATYGVDRHGTPIHGLPPSAAARPHRSGRRSRVGIRAGLPWVDLETIGVYCEMSGGAVERSMFPVKHRLASTGESPGVLPDDEFGLVLRVAGASQRFSFLLGLAAGKLLDVGRERRCHGGILVLQRCSSVRSTGDSVSASEEVASRDHAVRRSHPSRMDVAVLVVDRRSVRYGLFRRHGAGVRQAT